MRLIDADALMRSMKSALDSENPSMWSGITDAKTAFRFAMDFVCTAPALSPDEVRGVGEWEQKEIFGVEETTIEQMQSARCSSCGKYHTTPFSYYFSKYNYCPNCGARMKGADGTE